MKIIKKVLAAQGPDHAGKMKPEYVYEVLESAAPT